mmetsp:Transcript_89291/g.171857  ORF Transcript_89291/g.171857 Transcript_89291/m.171857 type:complete len:674 (-) Transcript_89291:45-2066(-)
MSPVSAGAADPMSPVSAGDSTVVNAEDNGSAVATAIGTLRSLLDSRPDDLSVADASSASGSVASTPRHENDEGVGLKGDLLQQSEDTGTTTPGSWSRSGGVSSSLSANTNWKGDNGPQLPPLAFWSPSVPSREAASQGAAGPAIAPAAWAQLPPSSPLYCRTHSPLAVPHHLGQGHGTPRVVPHASRGMPAGTGMPVTALQPVPGAPGRYWLRPVASPSKQPLRTPSVAPHTQVAFGQAAMQQNGVPMPTWPFVPVSPIPTGSGPCGPRTERSAASATTSCCSSPIKQYADHMQPSMHVAPRTTSPTLPRCQTLIRSSRSTVGCSVLQLSPKTEARLAAISAEGVYSCQARPLQSEVPPETLDDLSGKKLTPEEGPPAASGRGPCLAEPCGLSAATAVGEPCGLSVTPSADDLGPAPPPSSPRSLVGGSCSQKQAESVEVCNKGQIIRATTPCTSPVHKTRGPLEEEERAEITELHAQRILEATLCDSKKAEDARHPLVHTRGAESVHLALRQTEAELRYTPRMEVDNYFRQSLRGSDHKVGEVVKQKVTSTITAGRDRSTLRGGSPQSTRGPRPDSGPPPAARTPTSGTRSPLSVLSPADALHQTSRKSNRAGHNSEAHQEAVSENPESGEGRSRHQQGGIFQRNSTGTPGSKAELPSRRSSTGSSVVPPFR